MRDHRSLLAWQVSRDLSTQVHLVTVRRWRPEARIAFDQLRRASLSARINISEGYGRRTLGQFAHFLSIAYGSALESTDLLEFCQEVNLLSASEVAPLVKLAHRAEALIIRLRHHVVSKV